MRVERIGNIAQFINGAPFKPEDWCENGMKIIRIQNLTDPSKPYNKTNRIVDRKYIVTKGDVLVSWSATIDVFTWEDEDALLNQHIFKVVFDKSKVDKFYFINALKETINELTKLAHGATMKHVVKGDFENHKIPLPALSDQLHIANILTKAENLIAKRKQSIALLDDYLKSTFLEMFGDPVRNEKGWKILSGENYLSKLTVGVVIKPASYYVEKGIIALRSLNIRPNRIGLNNLVYFSQEAHEKELSKSILREGDVVFVRTGMTGTAAIIPKELDGCNCIDLIVARPKDGVMHPKYLVFFFNSDIGKRIVTAKEVGGIQKHFNIGALRKLTIPVPSIELQTQFAQIVEKTEALKTQYQSSLHELEQLYGSLSQRAFRGELTLPKAEEQLSMAAESEVKYGKVVPFTSRKCEPTETAVLGGHIINQTNNEDFGRVKFQKLLHLTSYNCKIDIGANFVKKVAGPHDGQLIKDIESTLQRYRFYDIKQTNYVNHKVNYTPLNSVDELEGTYKTNFAAESEQIDAFLSKFRKSTWEQCEIISTLYAVWNNRIIKNEAITDELLKQDFLAWDPKKKKYIDRLDNALQWMRDQQVIPDGWGKPIE